MPSHTRPALSKKTYDIRLLLLFHQAGVTGHAPPHRILVNPGIGEAAVVLEGLALIGTFGVVPADNNGHVRVRENLHPLVGDQCGAIRGISQVGEKLGLVHYRAVVVGVHKGIAD